MYTILIFFIIVFNLSYFFARSQRKFLKQLRRKINPDYPLTYKEAIQSLINDPFKFLFGDVLHIRYYKLVFKKYNDQELEEAAKIVRIQIIISLCLVIVFFACIYIETNFINL